MTAEPTTADIRKSRPSKPRRSWRQFSLRTLLLAMVVVSVGLALFAWRLQRARRQAAAVATIRKLGGSITYDYQRDARKRGGNAKAESSIPAWLVKWLGEDFFHEVVESTMHFQQPKSDDDVRTYWSAVSQLHRLELFQAMGKWVDGRLATEAVGQHSRLKNLHLSVGNLRGSDLAPLAGLYNLETLSLSQNPIGDDGAENFEHFPKLKYVSLFFTDIGDQTAAKLAANKEIVTLQIDASQVSDRGVEKLATLPNLKVLKLGRTKITDEGLHHLANLRQLEFLGLSGCKITDRGLARLSPLVNLRGLELQQTQISGSAFESLQGLAKLEILMLGGQRMTDEGAIRAMRFPRLKTVILSGSPLTIDSLGKIEWPNTLELVTLHGTGLTDDGLMRLAKCPNLRSVGASGTKVTPEGIKRFQQALPRVNVH